MKTGGWSRAIALWGSHQGQGSLEEEGVVHTAEGLAGRPEDQQVFIVNDYFQASEPGGHLAQKTFLEPGAVKWGTNENKSWAPCFGAPGMLWLWSHFPYWHQDFSTEVLSQATIAYLRAIENYVGNRFQNNYFTLLSWRPSLLNHFYPRRVGTG